MKSSKQLLLGFCVWMVLSVIACGEIPVPEKKDDVLNLVSLQPLDDKDIEITQTVEMDDQIGDRDVPIISVENVDKLVLQERIYPYFPEIVQISTEGSRAAVGNLSGVKVVDIITSEILMQIDIPIQMCNFGFRNLFQLNHAGSFIAIALKDRIEVRQVGGGVIYETPYLNNHVLDPLTCGADIPQLAISPDGKFLAENGLQISLNEMESYFRVTNIIENIVIYEWEGSSASPHGQLYTFPGLGFSSDGNVLQTFDPTRYRASGSEFLYPFRFWSTSNWEELAPNSKEVINGFSEGNLLFGRSANDSIVIFDKVTGVELKTINADGCILEDPCDVKFSPDGSKIAVLSGRQDEIYKRESISTILSIYEISDGKLIDDYPVQSRDLDGISVNNDGDVLRYEENISDNRPKWWTQTDYFSGFRLIDEKTIAFTPQIVIKDGQPQDPYTSSCQIREDGYSIECSVSLMFQDGFSIGIEKKSEGISIFETTDGDHKLLAEVRIPEGEVSDIWQFRLLNYSGLTGMGLFCVNRNSREDSCFIMDLLNNKILYDRIDLSEFQYSEDSRITAFIDQNKRSLFLFFVDNNSLKQMRTYQAISLPVKPAFLQNGEELIYIIQGLENQKNVYIERINAVEGKVIRRYDIDEIKTIEISSIAVSPNEEIWAVADKNGKVIFIDPIKQAVVFSFQAMEEGIVDMLFSQDGKSILTIGRSSVITVWVVEE
ncbi:MAG: hypothetical protein Q7J07_04010 [Pelolinea sp.]|nr:hypothetical protein [Pelolinea sp.]